MKRRLCFVNTRRRTIVEWYFCAMCLCPHASFVSIVVDGSPRLYSLPFRQSPQCNVSIVGSGAELGRRAAAAAAAGRLTKPRQEHKHHQNMALSATVAALKRCTNHWPDWAPPSLDAALCAGLPLPHQIPLVVGHLIRSLPKVFEG